VPKEEQLTVEDLFLERGMLRRRLSTDPVDVRVNDSGERLTLRLLTSASPPEYRKAADIIRDQWGRLGVHVGIEIPDTREQFEQKLLKRDYDVLLFGQSLLDNLDSYPYWHSSGVQKTGGEERELRIDAYNLSQYLSLAADTLLEHIRQTFDEKERQEELSGLRDILKKDVPAIFLYSPLYTFAYKANLQGIELGKLSLHSDRFLTLDRWYLKERRRFRSDKGWLSFPGWVLSQII
jgi:peptide/nickel transport system substrate-binding protein